MPSEKRVSDGICAPCVRLHFVFTKLIVATPLFLCGLHRMWKIKRCRLKKGFRRHLCAMRTITLCFHKANRTYGTTPLFLRGLHRMWKIKRCRLKKRVSDGICAPCVRLRFVFTKLIVPTVLRRYFCVACIECGK